MPSNLLSLGLIPFLGPMAEVFKGILSGLLPMHTHNLMASSFGRVYHSLSCLINRTPSILIVFTLPALTS